MALRYVLSALAALILHAPSVSALSCAQPDLMQAMETVKVSHKTYYVLVGTFKPDPSAPRSKPNPPPKMTTGVWPPRSSAPAPMQVLFEGYSLTQDRRSDVYLSEFPITVRTSCIGSWCSSPPSFGDQKIAFVQVNPGQPHMLRIAPCSDKIFQVRPQEDPIRRLRSCFDKPCIEDWKPPRH